MAKQDYARVIREARKNAGLSQEGLAARLGVSRNAVAGWETGHSRPDLDLIADLCHALQISTDHFFGRPASPAAQSRKALNLFASLKPEHAGPHGKFQHISLVLLHAGFNINLYHRRNIIQKIAFSDKAKRLNLK